MENKMQWIFWQRVFSMIGILAVLGADILVVATWVK
jgi:hypothetical protein